MNKGLRVFAYVAGILCLSWTLPGAYAELFYPETEAEIHDALDSAESNDESDTIYIQSHHYNLTATLSFKPAAGHSRHSLTIEGVSGSNGVPRLDGMSQYQVLNIDTATSGDDYSCEIVLRNLVLQNAGETTFGAGLHLYCIHAEATILDCTFINNHCLNQGGAIFANTCSDLLIANCLFLDNSASDSGLADGAAGLHLRQYFETARILNNTFLNNVSDHASDNAMLLISNADAVICNNIFWPGGTMGYSYSGSIINFYRNIVDEYWFSGAGAFYEGHIFNVDPDLDAGFNPNPGSPCIDAGGPFEGVPDTDCRGNPRPNPDTGIVDIGAVEYYGSFPTATPTPGATPTAIWYELIMPDTMLHPGEEFALSTYCGNPGTEMVPVDEYIILDVYGSYWFWPDWTQTTGCWPGDLDPGMHWTTPVLNFTWPSDSGTATGLKFWGAFLHRGTSTLIVFDMIEWGYTQP